MLATARPRPWLPLIFGLLCSIAFLGGCTPRFVARDVYYDNTLAPRFSKTEIALVALSQEEYKRLESMKSEESELQKKGEEHLRLVTEGDWSGRSVKREISGDNNSFKVVGNDDPVWGRFRSAKDPKGNPAVWCVLVVLKKDWIGGDKAYAGYQGNPDEFNKDLPSVSFQWKPSEKGGDRTGPGFPELLSRQDGGRP